MNPKDLNIFASGFSNLFFSKVTIGVKLDIKYSDAIKNVTGYSASDIEGLPNKLSSILHEEDKLRVKNQMSEFLSGERGKEYSISYRIINDSDEVVWLNEKLLAEYDVENKIVGYNSVIIDISSIRNESKDLEDHNLSLIDLDKLKDKFISVVSHDLKSPYTTILGFSEILMNDDTLHEKEKREYLSYIYDGAQLQLKLIEHLLDWSRLRTGKTVIENQRLNLRNLISTAVSKQTGEAVRKNIDIHQNVPANIFVNSDEKQLRRAVSDILNNAIKYSHQDSLVTISADKFKGGLIEIVIKDSGVGISNEDQTKLFKLDKKFSKNGTNNEHGSGMGLIVVREILDKLKGDIWFYSTEGEGSEFHLTVLEAKNQIMIVSTENDYHALKGKLLSDVFSNYEIINKTSGFEAVQSIETELPTIIIVRDNMPLMDGLELIKLVRNRDKYYSVSLIVLTESLSSEISEKYEPYMVDQIILESAEDKQLINTINRLLKKQQ